MVANRFTHRINSQMLGKRQRELEAQLLVQLGKNSAARTSASSLD
jgi:hypothetical protein